MIISHFAGLLVCITAATCAQQHKLLLISFDGFRYDYIDEYQPSNFVKFASQGVHAKTGMKPSYPSKTFPNHYTLATGLYPESHGIVDNTMYDPLWNETFTQGTTTSKWFEGGEPIWITARLQGLKTGVYFWVGSESTIKNITANYWLHYDKKVPFEERVDTAIGWLAEDKVSFAAIYFEEPDGAGHKNGAMSEAVRKTVGIVNDLLGYIIEQMEKYKLHEDTNIILVADHGMANVSRAINDSNLIIDKYLTADDYIAVIQSGTIASILPKPGKDAIVRDKLMGKSPNVDVYLKEDIPAEFHYNNNRRIMPVIAIPKEPYQAVRTATELLSSYGNHGYNNSNPSMHALFMASGPSFRKGLKVDTFENVNIYPLLCELLGVIPSANNGTIENVRHMLINHAMVIPVPTFLVAFLILFNKLLA